MVAFSIFLLLSLVCHVFSFSARYAGNAECKSTCEHILIIEDVPPLISSAFYFSLTPYFLAEQSLVTTAIVSDANSQPQIARVSINSGMYVLQLRDMVGPITIRLTIPSNAMTTLPTSAVHTGVVCLEQPLSEDTVCKYLSPVPLSIPFRASVARGAASDYMLEMSFPFAVPSTSSVLINFGENDIFALDATQIVCASSSVPTFPGLECPIVTSAEVAGHDDVFRYTARFPLSSYSPYRVEVPSAAYPIALMLPWSSASPLQAVIDHVAKHAEVRAHPSDPALFLIFPLTPTSPTPVYPLFPKTVDAAEEEICVEVGSCWHLLSTFPLSWAWAKGHPLNYGVFVRGLLGVEAEEVVWNIIRRGGGFLSTPSRISLVSSSGRNRSALVSASSRGAVSLSADGDISWDGVVSGTMLSVVVAAGLQGFRPYDEITLVFNFVIREFDMFIARYAMCSPQPPHSVVCTLSAHVPHDRNGVSALHLYSVAFARTPKVHVNVTHTFPSAHVEASDVMAVTLTSSGGGVPVAAVSARAVMVATESMVQAGAGVTSPSSADAATASPVASLSMMVSTVAKTTAVAVESLSSTFKAFSSISLVSLPTAIDPLAESSSTSPFLQTGFVSPPVPSHTVLDNHFLLVEVGCLLDIPTLYANDAPCERISKRILRCPFNYHISQVVDAHPFSLSLFSFTYHKSVAVRASPVLLRRMLEHDVLLELEKRAIAAHVMQPFDITANSVTVTLGARNVTLNVDIGVVGGASRLFFPSVDRLVMNTTVPLFRSAFISSISYTGTFTPIIPSHTASALPGNIATGAIHLDDAAVVEIECHAFSPYVLVCILSADSPATDARFTVTVPRTETKSALPVTTGLSVGVYTGTSVQECGGDAPLSPTDDNATSTVNAKNGGWTEYVTDSSAITAAAAYTRSLASQVRNAAFMSTLHLMDVSPFSMPGNAAAVLPASWISSGVVTKDSVDLEYVGPVHEVPIEPENSRSAFPWLLLTPLWVAIAAGLCSGVYCCHRNCAMSAEVAPEEKGMDEPTSHCIDLDGDKGDGEQCASELVARSRQANGENGELQGSQRASTMSPSLHWDVEMVQLDINGRRTSSDVLFFEDDRSEFIPSSDDIASSSSSEEDERGDTTASDSASEGRIYLQAFASGLPVFDHPLNEPPVYSPEPFYGSTGQWTYEGAPQINESKYYSMKRPVWWVWPICERERYMRKMLPICHQVGFFLLDKIIYNLPRYVLPKNKRVRRRAARARRSLRNRKLIFAILCRVKMAAELLSSKTLSMWASLWKDHLASLGMDYTSSFERVKRTDSSRVPHALVASKVSLPPTLKPTPAFISASISLSSRSTPSDADKQDDSFSHEYNGHNTYDYYDQDDEDAEYELPGAYAQCGRRCLSITRFESPQTSNVDVGMGPVRSEYMHEEALEALSPSACVDSVPSCEILLHPVNSSHPNPPPVALPIAVSVFDPSDDLIILCTPRADEAQAPPHALARMPKRYTPADAPTMELPSLPTQAPQGECYFHRVPVHDILRPDLLPSQVEAEEYMQVVPPMFVAPPSPFAASHIQYDPAQPAELRVVNGMALRLKPDVMMVKTRHWTPVMRPIANAFDLCPRPPLPALHSQNSVAAIQAEDYSAIVAAPDLLPHPNVPEQRRLYTHFDPIVPVVECGRCPSSSSLRADMQQALGYTPSQASHALATSSPPPAVSALAPQPHREVYASTQCQDTAPHGPCGLNLASPYSIHHTQWLLRRALERHQNDAKAQTQPQASHVGNAAMPQSIFPSLASPKDIPQPPVLSDLPSPLPRLHDGIRPKLVPAASMYEPLQTPYLIEFLAQQYMHAEPLYPQYQPSGTAAYHSMPQAHVHAHAPLMLGHAQQYYHPVSMLQNLAAVAPTPTHQYLSEQYMFPAAVSQYMPESPAPQYLPQVSAPRAIIQTSLPQVVYGIPAPQPTPQAPVIAPMPQAMYETPICAPPVVAHNVATPPQAMPETLASLYPSVPTAAVDQLSLLPPMPRGEGRRRALTFPPLSPKVTYTHLTNRD